MKLPAKHTTRRYELTYLLPVSYTETELKGLREGVQELLTKFHATVETTEDWGKRRLAYAIKHKQKAHTEAFYVHIVFTADPSVIPSLDGELKLNETIMRYLLVVVDEVKPTESGAEKSA